MYGAWIVYNYSVGYFIDGNTFKATITAVWYRLTKGNENRL